MYYKFFVTIMVVWELTKNCEFYGTSDLRNNSYRTIETRNELAKINRKISGAKTIRSGISYSQHDLIASDNTRSK